MRFLFTTLQTYESDFYGQVGEELATHGHDAVHITVSRASAAALRARGIVAECLTDTMRDLPEPELDTEIARIEATYDIPSIRDIYRADWPCEGRGEAWCLRRTVLHVQALERLVDELCPDVIVPEVGNETIRVVTHLIGLAREIPVFFLFYTLFPNPLRLYVDTMHAPIVPPENVRELDPDQVREVESFRQAFIKRAQPIRAHRRVSFEPRRALVLAGHVSRRLQDDRDNDYLRPGRLLALNASEFVRAHAARPFYDRVDQARPYVYFPLHVTDDYKIKRVIPHCVDQASLVEQVADALPVGYDLVLKEHPMSIGRNSLALLRRMRKRRNVYLVEPHANTHVLIRGSAAVAVISSTVGLEALLYDRPVLTLGRPFYSGYGITLDVDSFAEIREAMPALLRFRPDPDQITRFLHAAMTACRPGAPVLVDRSIENARTLAASLDSAVHELVTV